MRDVHEVDRPSGWNGVDVDVSFLEDLGLADDRFSYGDSHRESHAADWGVESRETATGEHGIGQGKREHLVYEHGEESVEAMRAIKRALDPAGTLNPGKLFPETIDDG